MKFIVKSLKDKKSYERNIDSGILFRLVTNLGNAGVFEASSKNAPTESSIKHHFLSDLQDAVNSNEKSNIYSLTRFPLKVTGSFNGDFFEVDSVELDEEAYTRPFSVNGVKKQRTEGLAKTILTSTIKNAQTNDNPSEPIKVKVGAVEVDEAENDAPKADESKTKQGWADVAKNTLLSIIPHAVVGATAYVFRNPIMAGITAVASRIGLMAVSAFVTPLSVVAAAVGLSAAFVAARNWFKRSKAASYEAKTADELDALSPNQVQAFLDGVKAQQSYTAQAQTCFNFNDYRHGNAFFAGMGAEAENKNELIENIKQRQPQA